MKRSRLTRAALSLLLAVLLVGCQDLNTRQPDAEGALAGAAAAVVRGDLVTGATLNGANGMYFGPDGNLYVAVFAGSEIVALNPRNGKIVARFGRDQGGFVPDGLTFGPNGSMYWMDIVVGQVGRMTPDGPGPLGRTLSETYPTAILQRRGRGLHDFDALARQPEWSGGCRAVRTGRWSKPPSSRRVETPASS